MRTRNNKIDIIIGRIRSAFQIIFGDAPEEAGNMAGKAPANEKADKPQEWLMLQDEALKTLCAAGNF